MKNPFKGFWKTEELPTKAVPSIEKKGTLSEIALRENSFLGYAFGGNGWVSANRAMGFYRQTSAIATAVDIIADSIELIDPVIKTKDGKFNDNHEVLDFLKRPNGFSTWNQFIGTVARNYLLKHDSLMVTAGNNNRAPIEMWPRSLQDISIVPDHDDYPKNYIVTRGNLPGNYLRVEKNKMKDIRFYDGPFKELYHIRGFSSRTDNTQSDSPLQAAAMEARQIIQGKYHNVKLLENGGRLSLLVTFKDEDEISDDEHQNRVQRLNETLGGSNNAGTIGVISGADVQHVEELGKSNKDMDYAVLETLAGHAIYLRYKIPLALVTNEASTFDNLKTGIELLYDNAVLPAVFILFTGLSSFLLPRFGIDPRTTQISVNPESIQALKIRRLAEVEQRKKIAVETTNELRTLLPNREPLEHGDTLYQPTNLVPIGTDTTKIQQPQNNGGNSGT